MAYVVHGPARRATSGGLDGRRARRSVDMLSRTRSPRARSLRRAPPSAHCLLTLFELHHTRRAQFRRRLAEHPFLTDAQVSDAPTLRPRDARAVGT
jgi:hypothetical protein